MTTTTELTDTSVVVTYADGTTAVGTHHLRRYLQDVAHGYREDEAERVYVNVDGLLVETHIVQSQGRFDDEDYACVTVRLVKRDSLDPEPLVTFTYSVDGRA